ncbi:hypothetical protein BDA99DRAFT_541143 [Phascolomyces articulosus]|uniref:Uncharacterized protein n=1 Tax=Phascolomyces articulosus TaxID=60185 RepID=A0AAD5JSP1_9FUNG|nr:hypothetical protein BDA99DRAFT_541143 [Phascolomyces articulosus]
MTISPTASLSNSMERSYTPVDLNTTGNVFEQGKHAYAEQDYNCAIELYSHALDQSPTKVMTFDLILHRAIAYDKQQHINFALADYFNAYSIKHGHDNVNSSSITSPSTTAHVATVAGTTTHPSSLSCNRRERQRQKALLCLEGANDDSIEESFRETLAQHGRNIMDDLDVHNQWLFRHLSYDVDRSQLSLTCRFWNKFILKNWDKMWETIDDFLPRRRIGHKNYDWDPRNLTPMPKDEHAVGLYLDGVIPDCVKHIKLDLNKYNRRSQVIIPKILDLPLKNVGSLVGRRYITLTTNERLPQMLRMGINTITAATLRYSTFPHVVQEFSSYGDALVIASQMCPNIQTITLYLMLSSSPTEDAIQSIGELLDRNPTLTLFELHNKHHHEQVLETVSNHCPLSLRELFYGDQESVGLVTRYIQHASSESLSSTSSSSITASTQPTGLKSLSLSFKYLFSRNEDHDLTATDLDETIGNLLMKHGNTLEDLTILWKPLHFKDRTLFFKLAKNGAPHSRSLYLDVNAFPVNANKFKYAKLIAMLIEACSALESVHLNNICLLDERVYHSLGQLKHLKRFGIETQSYDQITRYNSIINDYGDYYNPVYPMIPISGMGMFFEKTVGLERFYITQPFTTKSAQECSVLICSDVYSLTSGISACPTLRELDISYIVLDNVLFIILLENIKKDVPSGLTKLIIRVPSNGVHEQEIKALASIGGTGILQYLIIHDHLYCFDEGGINKLVQIFEAYQGLEPFLIHVKLIQGGHFSSFCKERSSLSSSLEESPSIKCCLFKKYNISSSRYMNEIKLHQAQVYCKECMCQHAA